MLCLDLYPSVRAMRCTSRRTASLMPISLASARETVLTETPRRSAMSAWFARFWVATAASPSLYAIFAFFEERKGSVQLVPSAEPAGEPDHLRPALKSLAAFMVVELIFL